jgi:hypothetical protein
MTTLKKRIGRLEASRQGEIDAAYDRVVPLLSDAELEALAAMPDGRPAGPEARAAMVRMWELFTRAERRILASEWKAAGVPLEW